MNVHEHHVRFRFRNAAQRFFRRTKAAHAPEAGRIVHELLQQAAKTGVVLHDGYFDAHFRCPHHDGARGLFPSLKLVIYFSAPVTAAR